MRGSPEKLIAGLRRKRLRIIASGILSVVLLGLLIAQWCLIGTVWHDSVFKEHSDLLFHVAMQQMMVIPTCSLIAQSMLVAALLGIMMAIFFINLLAYSKDDLLVELWDRIEALEHSIATQSEEPT
jgi:uncharacterized membrane protein YhaH (DUF805 family)